MRVALFLFLEWGGEHILGIGITRLRSAGGGAVRLLFNKHIRDNGYYEYHNAQEKDVVNKGMFFCRWEEHGLNNFFWIVFQRWGCGKGMVLAYTTQF